MTNHRRGAPTLRRPGVAATLAAATLAAVSLTPASLAAGGAFGASVASAQSEPTLRQVRALLSGYEDVPSDEDWRRLGPATLAHLVTLYADAAQPAYVRLRAVGAAGAFSVPAARTFLRAVVAAPDQSDLVVRQALRALKRAFGDDAAGDLTAQLEHPAPVVREAAARELRGTSSARARSRIRQRLEVERSVVVREALERALR